MQPVASINRDAQKISSIINTGGLNAAETGSTDDAVLRFAAAGTIIGPGIAEATTAANGTIVTITRPGWYNIELRGVTKATTVVDVGISANVAAAGLNSDPAYTIAGMLVAQGSINSTLATTQLPIVLDAKLEVIKGASALVRFHATNGSDAAPDFSTTLASFYFRIVRLGNTRGHS